MNIATKITTLTSREFNQDLARAKRAAKDGPVMVTDRGEPAFVLLSFEEYEKLKAEEISLSGVEPADDQERRRFVDLLAMPAGVEDFEFDIPISRELARAAEFD